MSSVACCFDWSQSGTVAVAFEDGSVQLFSKISKFSSKSLSSHGGRITCLRWSKNSKWLILGGNNTITIWDIRNESRRQLDSSTIPGLNGPGYDLLWKNNKIFVWHTKRNKIFVADLAINGLLAVEVSLVSKNPFFFIIFVK